MILNVEICWHYVWFQISFLLCANSQHTFKCLTILSKKWVNGTGVLMIKKENFINIHLLMRRNTYIWILTSPNLAPFFNSENEWRKNWCSFKFMQCTLNSLLLFNIASNSLLLFPYPGYFSNTIWLELENDNQIRIRENQK